MKKIIFFIFVFFISLSVFARKDSTRLSSFKGIYINAYVPYYAGGSYTNYYQKSWFDYDQFRFQFKQYNYVIPAIGIGYVINKNGLYLKGDVNYWYGSKKLDDDFEFKANLDGSRANEPTWFIYYDQLGSQHYHIKDHVKGVLNTHNIDFCFALTGNITRFLRIYRGFRFNLLSKYNFNAVMERERYLYQIGNNGDSLVAVEPTQQFRNNDIKNYTNFGLEKISYFDWGINFNFRIRKQLFMADVQYESSNVSLFFGYSNPSYAALNFKLSYLVDYSTHFRKRKSKK